MQNSIQKHSPVLDSARRFLSVLHSSPRSRLFSSSSNEVNKLQPASSSSSMIKWLQYFRRTVTVANIRKNWTQITIGTGAVVILYVISSVSLHVATTLLEIDMKHVFYVGFLTGSLTVGSLAFLLLRTRSSNTINPDAVVYAAIGALQRNSEVRNALGATLKIGGLRGYTVQNAHFAVSKFGWVDPRVKMLFQVDGSNGREGFATCEAVKHQGKIQFSLLVLDLLDSKQLLLVEGKEEKLHVKGILRGFLQTERAQYVAQDKVISDVDMLSEQVELDSTSHVGVTEEELLKKAESEEKLF